MQPPDYTFNQTRLDHLDRFNILDTPAEQGFDDIVYLASQMCETPVALVSLVTGDRQWFKARVGFEPCETDLSRSVCAHALVQPDLLIIADLTTDPRTMNNPLVTAEPFIRFYAGAPLRASNGEVMGSLCVIDGKPRPAGLSDQQAEGLRRLGRQVVTQMELRSALAERDGFIADAQKAETRRNGLLHLGERLRAVNTIPEVTSAAAEVVGRTLGIIRAGFGRVDGSGEFIDVERDWAAEGHASTAGRHRLADYGDLAGFVLRSEPVVISDVMTDTQFALPTETLKGMGIRAMANMPVRDHEGTIALFFAHCDKPREWTAEDLTFLRNAGDRVAASVARIDAEALQHVLNLELSHRMKNTLAMVQAIAKQTLRVVPDQAPVDAFRLRLQALATAHEALLHQSWTAAKMSDIVTNVLSVLERIDRFSIAGPLVNIGARATLSLSLLLHELSTNAMKYGALSQPTGRVRVTWDVAGDELVLRWQETGGPPAAEPTQKGFGSRLINMGLIGTGGVDLRYLSTGFEAIFTAPLSQVQQS